MNNILFFDLFRLAEHFQIYSSKKKEEKKRKKESESAETWRTICMNQQIVGNFSSTPVPATRFGLASPGWLHQLESRADLLKLVKQPERIGAPFLLLCSFLCSFYLFIEGL